MIRSLTARTIHEITQEMHRAGLQMSDIDGTIHTNESGHYYVLFEETESDTGAMDVTAGTIGYSVGDLSSSTQCSVGEYRTEVTGETVTDNSAVANASGNYIIPRSVEIEFSGSAHSERRWDW